MRVVKFVVADCSSHIMIANTDGAVMDLDPTCKKTRIRVWLRKKNNIYPDLTLEKKPDLEYKTGSEHQENPDPTLEKHPDPTGSSALIKRGMEYRSMPALLTFNRFLSE